MLVSLQTTIEDVLTTVPATPGEDYAALFELVRQGALTETQAAEIMGRVHIKRAVGRIERGQYVRVEAM